MPNELLSLIDPRAATVAGSMVGSAVLYRIWLFLRQDRRTIHREDTKDHFLDTTLEQLEMMTKRADEFARERNESQTNLARMEVEKKVLEERLTEARESMEIAREQLQAYKLTNDQLTTENISLNARLEALTLVKRPRRAE